MKKPTSKVVVRLRLYVAGKAPNSVHAIANAKALFLEPGASEYALEIVDLMVHPSRALTDGIIVTPTLLKVSPPPIRRVIGTLSDADEVLAALGTK